MSSSATPPAQFGGSVLTSSKSGSRSVAAKTPSRRSSSAYSKNSMASSTKQDITYGTASGFVDSASVSKQSITPFGPTTTTKGSRTGSFLSSPKTSDKSKSASKSASRSRSALRGASKFSAMKSGTRSRLSPPSTGGKTTSRSSKTLSRTGLSASSASRGRSATGTTGSGAPVFSKMGKSKTGSSYKESSVEALTPRSRSKRSNSKSYKISRSRSAPSATSALSCRTGASKCANHAHLHKGLVKAVSGKGTTKAWSTVSRTTAGETTIDVKPRQKIILDIPAREEKTRYRTNWCAMACLALLMCGLLVFLLVKHFAEENASNSTTARPSGATGGSTGNAGQSS